MGEHMTTEGDGSLFTEEFARFAKETLKEWKVPGVSIAVIDGEDVFTQVCLSLTTQYLKHSHQSLNSC